MLNETYVTRNARMVSEAEASEIGNSSLFTFKPTGHPSKSQGLMDEAPIVIIERPGTYKVGRLYKITVVVEEIRCTLAIPHEEHEDENTGLTWTEELPEMSNSDGYPLGNRTTGPHHDKGWNPKRDSDESAGDNSGRGKPPKSGEHDRPSKK